MLEDRLGRDSKEPLLPHEIVTVGVAAIGVALEVSDRELLVASLDATASALRDMRVSERYSPIELVAYGLSAGRAIKNIDPKTLPLDTAARFTRQTALSLLSAVRLNRTYGRNPDAQ